MAGRSPRPTLNVQRLSSSTEPSLEQRQRPGGTEFRLRTGNGSFDQTFANFPDALDIETYAPSVAGIPTIRGALPDAHTHVLASPGSLRFLYQYGRRTRRATPCYQRFRYRPWCFIGGETPSEPIAAGEYIASQIPGAKFIALQGVDHVPFGDTSAWTGGIEES